MAADYDGLYEASDEASENEMLESSLSKWKGFCVSNENDFNPIPLDIHTAASVGQYDCIQMAVKRYSYVTLLKILLISNLCFNNVYLAQY